jgi:hypothetical protein
MARAMSVARERAPIPELCALDQPDGLGLVGANAPVLEIAHQLAG